MKQDFVILVDEHGNDLPGRDGRPAIMDKIEAHRRGLMHRAISVFIFNDKMELLLQKRASDKYHSPDKWSNTCCTHPLPGEPPLLSAQRRLFTEMGIETALTEVCRLSYRVETGNGLIENEFDHVFLGNSTDTPRPDPDEVSDWKWMGIEKLKRELDRSPEKYSAWFRYCVDGVTRHKHFLL